MAMKDFFGGDADQFNMVIIFKANDSTNHDAAEEKLIN